jgi:glucose/arabinose dehydrogenase
MANARRATLAAACFLAAVVMLGPTCRPSGTVIVATGLAAPMYVTAPTGDPRLFILERAGRVRIHEDGALLPTPFLDITTLVSTTGEGGLLGLAFSPQYSSNGQFYIFYSDLAGDTVLARVLRSATDPDRADAASLFPLLTLDPPNTNHKGGTIAFSPVDGFLYVGVGDGGSSANARSPSSLLGKFLRLNVAGGPTTPYTIPSSNPFVGPDGIRDEIWAFGFRNPFRWSFDRATGDLWIGDVGQQTIEEVDFETPGDGGLDYGWPTHEGTNCFQPDATHPCDDPQNPSLYAFPVTQYTHADGCSVTGGVRFRGTSVIHTGKYFFADFCSGKVWTYVDGQTLEQTNALGGPFPGLVAISEDGFGEVYLTELNAGRVRRLK